MTQPMTFHRSGAVARMLRMPVATLRVWERRYGVTQPQLSPSGQRLYSGDDVRRLALIKQLADLGHAIGSLAPLDMAQLQRVAATHAQTLASGRKAQATTRPARTGGSFRLLVIGPALATRLRRPALLRRIGQPVELLGPFEDLAQALAAHGQDEVDGVLFHQPQLHAGWLAEVDAQAPDWTGLPRAVLYGYAADAVCDWLADAGLALLREPQPDAVLGPWLARLTGPAAATATGADTPPAAGLPESGPVPPRRWDDAALADFAGLSSTIACECPSHIAELLVQLSRFEAYSAECAHRSAADAALHQHLQQVTAGSRARFEDALERVARHEGLLLPGTAAG
ncbi:MerR family transcriptional regulator [Leptothrix discophora]|uniref:MerR family transcriptional regulator n=1 Tax=Leptothrix discophora TaxID=89 RepID=A0ABT9G8H5_LEPDI|nr:MerR family transcriptional regulator [Leptothrix discophora]MDP4302783.1 MerR family transcriptional regulator [Leptothrix discophora]